MFYRMNGQNYNFKSFELQKIDCAYTDIRYIDSWLSMIRITFENKTWDLFFVLKDIAIIILRQLYSQINNR